MTEWKAKRFWKDTSIEPIEGGYGVLLDSRPVLTPSKFRLCAPTEKMAKAVASEWAAQKDVVDPRTMPWTRSINSAIEKVSTQRSEVEEHLASYAGTDLLCYRASEPKALVERQAAAWDPVLGWLASETGAKMRVTVGVMPAKQDPAVLARLAGLMRPMTICQLTGFHDLVTVSGSFVLAFAVAENHLESTRAWENSRVDENWQIEQWGEDEEAQEVAALKKEAFLHATEFFRAAS